MPGRAASGRRVAVAAVTDPADIRFLRLASLGAIVRMDGPQSPTFKPDSLARVLALLGSRDTRAERQEEASSFRLAAERIKDTLVTSGSTRFDGRRLIARSAS